MQLSGILQGKKTYVAAGISVIGAIAAYLTGDATATQAFQLVMSALLAAGVRNGIANS